MLDICEPSLYNIRILTNRENHTMAMINTVIDQVARMDIDELNRVADAIKLRRTWIGNQTRRSLILGDKVSFTGRRGLKVTGVVKKISIKNVIVSAGTTNWRVPANMLEKVA